MTLTGTKVESDVFAMVKGSALETAINGGVYHAGTRPRDSKSEDIVVRYSSGSSVGVQSGIVSVFIYVQDIAPFSDGVFVKDGERVLQLEALASDWVSTLTADKSNYLFSLADAIATDSQETTHEHVVVIQLYYRYIDL